MKESCFHEQGDDVFLLPAIRLSLAHVSLLTMTPLYLPCEVATFAISHHDLSSAYGGERFGVHHAVFAEIFSPFLSSFTRL